MSTLERAIAIAAEAHAGDTDKAGAPYIFHPLRVMNACRTVEERIVAVLHDVVDGVDALTRRDGEDYLDFVARAREHPLGRVVKRADLRDNLDLDRIPSPGPDDYERLIRYVKALAVLDGVEDAREW